MRQHTNHLKVFYYDERGEDEGFSFFFLQVKFVEKFIHPPLDQEIPYNKQEHTHCLFHSTSFYISLYSSCSALVGESLNPLLSMKYMKKNMYLFFKRFIRIVQIKHFENFPYFKRNIYILFFEFFLSSVPPEKKLSVIFPFLFHIFSISSKV